jgi:tetratricopeptide (TPR) repeat protein
MKRLVPVLCAACVVGIAFTAHHALRAGQVDLEVPPIPTQPAAGEPAPTSPTDLLARDLAAARSTCTPEALDPIVARLRERTNAAADDARAFHLLAEALLERALLRSHLRGMAVGKPVYPELPPELAADVDGGLAAAQRARELGDEDGDLHRIEAGLMSQKITGLTSALQWNQKIVAALERAKQSARDNPHLHVVLGLRKLLAPKLLGHDPDGALQHFEFAAGTLDDERPAVFAAMASHLQQKREQAITWLERAAAKNPRNVFARVVLERLRRGEQDPFARDVTPAEAAALAK